MEPALAGPACGGPNSLPASLCVSWQGPFHYLRTRFALMALANLGIDKIMVRQPPDERTAGPIDTLARTEFLAIPFSERR